LFKYAWQNGAVFAEYTMSLMMRDAQRTFDMREPVMHNDSDTDSDTDTEERQGPLHAAACTAVTLGSCSDVRMVQNVAVAALNQPGVLFRPTTFQTDFIDFAYATKSDENELHVHAFQSTVEARRERDGIDDFEYALCNHRATVYFVVPVDQNQEFKAHRLPLVAKAHSQKIDFKILQIPQPRLLVRRPVASRKREREE
jgi:hypothetical protein